MELHQLRVLREVADQGSIAAAARALSVTPSAVSQVLTALQREFEVPLTEREGRVVTLSDAGRTLSLAAIRVETAMTEAQTAIDESMTGSSPVTVSAFHSAAAAFFPKLASAPASPEFPAVTCSDEDVPQDEFPSLTSKYDIVIGHRLSHATPWPQERLRIVPLLEEPLDVALRSDHPLAKNASLTPSDIVSANWVSTHEHFSPNDMLRAIAAAAGEPVRVVHRINDFATAAAVVSRTDLLALLPRYTSVVPERSGVTLRPVSGVRSVRHIDALLRPDRAARTSVGIVLNALHNAAEALIDQHDPA